MAADTGKGLAFPVAAQLHALMANRAAGVRLFGDRFRWPHSLSWQTSIVPRLPFTFSISFRSQGNVFL
ncbi:hypothetical protein PO124_27280 [Bacillus licheniformis]|nr:hypothetical protein [Bacillus licheniformis]